MIENSPEIFQTATEKRVFLISFKPNSEKIDAV